MKKQYDAIVIGAGIIGACISFELAKAGRRVLCIDKNPSAGYGSTSNSCAIIRTHYSTLDGAALALSNYPYWENWAKYLETDDELGLIQYKEVGCIYTCFSQNDYGRKLIDIAEKLSIPYEIWTPEIMRQRVPIIDSGNYYPARRPDDPEFGQAAGEMRHVIFFPKAGFISDPQLATHNVQRAAEAHGAMFTFADRVATIDNSNGCVSGITTESGKTYQTQIVVNAAGPHSYMINELAGVTDGMAIKTRALRVEVAHIPSPTGFDFEADGIIGSDANIGGYYRPEVGNHILVGSEEPECDGLDWVDPDNYVTDISNQARVQAMRAAQRFPAMNIPNNVKGIVDLYDVTDDWIPIYDKSDLKGFYMAIGTSGNQFKNGPVVGKMMTALIDYVESGVDHDEKPLVFPLPNLQQYEQNLCFFSRRRELNRGSSFSVVG
ncbi:MAG: FAD-dependent oxidoreductase [Gammaproteobacteria bacterium]|jgi:sarcosine oxidase subunit beta|nr:FAD-dependent oxidoreductase [Gammaproteobacteria bacterium]MDP7455243.1 FAD-dependent oxidoreductase [Gammaproteobacteria bacterium]|tara:strand:- start:3228 stop:4532 length:1305 start_codon:yes stop_codon:yes gene_type:complete